MRDELGSTELERRLSRSLQTMAPMAAPDLADRLMSRTRETKQRRRWMRWSSMMPLLPAAAAMIVLAVVVGLQLGGLMPRTGEQPIGSSTPTGTPVVTEPASPSPSPSSTSTPSAEVFPGGGSCTNEAFGFAVRYPADWFANEAAVPDDEALDPVAACRYFSDEPMEITPNAGLPPTVAITFSVEEEEQPSSGTIISSEEVTIAGRPATVTEREGSGDGPFFAEGDFSYSYQITLADGQILFAGTYYANEGDYEAHKQVLDLMMETLVLTGS